MNVIQGWIQQGYNAGFNEDSTKNRKYRERETKKPKDKDKCYHDRENEICHVQWVRRITSVPVLQFQFHSTPLNLIGLE